MSVRPVLLGLYEKYFLPLQKLLLPSLQAFLVGLLPGLEEGSEIYDRLVNIVSGVLALPVRVWGLLRHCKEGTPAHLWRGWRVSGRRGLSTLLCAGHLTS